MEHTTLYYRQGASDKMYQASITPKDGGFVVPFASAGADHAANRHEDESPVPYEKAKAIYDKLVGQKLGKGYSPARRTPLQYTEREAQTTGSCRQPAEPIEETEEAPTGRKIPRPAAGEIQWPGQLIKKPGETVIGINRRGAGARPGRGGDAPAVELTGRRGRGRSTYVLRSAPLDGEELAEP